jgi:hypothetical protein
LLAKAGKGFEQRLVVVDQQHRDTVDTGMPWRVDAIKDQDFDVVLVALADSHESRHPITACGAVM